MRNCIHCIVAIQMERFNKPVNMGRNSPDYKWPFKIREPTYTLHRAQNTAMELPSSPAASAPASAGERWPPLESSPEVFNQVQVLSVATNSMVSLSPP